MTNRLALALAELEELLADLKTDSPGHPSCRSRGVSGASSHQYEHPHDLAGR